MNAVDLRLSIKICVNRAVTPPIGAKDLIDTAFHFLDLSVRLNIQHIFGVEENRVCFFIVSGKRRIRHRMHPLGRVRALGGGEYHKQ